MKKKTIIIILSFFICLSSALSSCNRIPSDNQSQDTQDESTNYADTRIKELEAQIITLLQSQQLSESERKKEISALKAELDALKRIEYEKATNESTESDAPKIFKYTLNGYKATITSINTEEESISIPSVIDGHAVVAIGSNVLNSTKVKRIVLEDGIETLDWFAFKG